MNIKLKYFKCPASGTDCPPDGFEVIESTFPGADVGEFLSDFEIQELESIGINIEISNEEQHNVEGYFDSPDDCFM